MNHKFFKIEECTIVNNTVQYYGCVYEWNVIDSDTTSPKFEAVQCGNYSWYSSSELNTLLDTITVDIY